MKTYSKLDSPKRVNQNFDENFKVTASDLKLESIQIKNEDAKHPHSLNFSLAKSK